MSKNVVRHDKTPVESTLLSHDMKRVTLSCDFHTLEVVIHVLSV